MNSNQGFNETGGSILKTSILSHKDQKGHFKAKKFVDIDKYKK